ncbi:MAG TPA: hypothetical protein VIU65_03280 [Pyrinomonadaceae bacterium]
MPTTRKSKTTRRKRIRTPDDFPPERPLKAYAFDPSQGKNLGNYMTANVRYEPLKPGPVGEYLAVIDYDASNDTYYLPVDLDDPDVLIRGGLDPSESDPCFHQQMVYAVASETIKRFEFALGRKPKWGFRPGRRDDPNRDKLRIFPHAMQEANAYYDRALRALVFGYFPASDTDPGANLPGQTIFTCLSHDVVVHETTHALIDGQRKFFLEPTGPDTPAFHEGFADIVALFQHFTYKDPIIAMIRKTGGLIYRMDVGPEVKAQGDQPLIQAEIGQSNPLVQLARQFGEAMGMRSSLRQALGKPPNPDVLKNSIESHDRGSVLVAAVFDAFYSIYLKRTLPLLRLAPKLPGGVYGEGDVHPDLAERIAKEATKTAEIMCNICIRALDYCPPIDISFGDFLRALITADYDLVPNDKYGYRAAFIEAFRLRGICPRGVTSYAEESLRWCPPEVMKGVKAPVCEDLWFDLLKPTTPENLEHNARHLSRFGKQHARALGLNSQRPVQAHSFHAVARVKPDGGVNVEIIAELMQQMDVDLDPKDKDTPAFTFRGGTTVVLTHEGKVRYAVQKSLGQDNRQNRRLQEQREYYRQLGEGLAIAPYLNRAGMETYLGRGRFKGRPMRFDLLHRGY